MTKLIRDTVMKLLREIDEEGVKQRAKRVLKRRVYRSKVQFGVSLIVMLLHDVTGTKFFVACRRI